MFNIEETVKFIYEGIKDPQKIIKKLIPICVITTTFLLVYIIYGLEPLSSPREAPLWKLFALTFASISELIFLLGSILAGILIVIAITKSEKTIDRAVKIILIEVYIGSFLWNWMLIFLLLTIISCSSSYVLYGDSTYVEFVKNFDSYSSAIKYACSIGSAFFLATLLIYANDWIKAFNQAANKLVNKEILTLPPENKTNRVSKAINEISSVCKEANELKKRVRFRK